MASPSEHVATLAALLVDETHFLQSIPAFREDYFQRTNERFATVPPHVAARDALALIRIGKGVARWALRYCNGEGHRVAIPRNGLQSWSWDWGADDDAAKEKADVRALKKAQAIADRYGATVKLGGDPRGYVFRLMLNSKRSNSFAGEGWGVI